MAIVFWNHADLLRTQNYFPLPREDPIKALARISGISQLLSLEVGKSLILRAPGDNLEMISHPLSLSLGFDGRL